MHTYNLQKGQSLIEIIFAIAIFTIGIVTIGYLIIDARASLHQATDLTQARLLAAEGIEAVVSMKGGGFDSLTDGTHGLALNQGYWSLVLTPDSIGKFERAITIESIDIDNKEVTSHVSWNVLGGKEKSVSYSTRVSNWLQTGGEAGDLDMAFDNVMLDASSTSLVGLLIRNIGSEDITITGMTLTWDSPVLLELITIDGTDVFNASTSGPVASGTEINITDRELGAYTGYHSVDTFTFDGSVAGTNFTLLFTLQDGSVRSVYISP